MQREAAPPAADLEHVVAGRELQLIADTLQLRALRICERRVLLGEDPAGVRHRLVEHQREELVAEVVVVGDVPPRAQQPVAAVRARPRLDHPAHEPVPCDRSLGVAEKQREEPHQVVGVPLAGRVRLAEADLAARRKAAEERAVVDRGAKPRDLRRTSACVPSGSVTVERSALEVRELAFEDRYGEAVDECAAGAWARRAALRSTMLMRAPTLAPARTAACGGTAPASARDSEPDGG